MIISPPELSMLPTLHQQEASLCRSIFPEGKLLLVSDDITHKILGERIISNFHAADIKYLSLQELPKANIENVIKIQENLADCVGIIAVGSGTINDLCKLAAYRADKKYVVFATAPSMNGYASANASISANGHKKSLTARPPAAIFCDLEIIAAAPKRLILAGLGDSVCRSTVQADCLLAHLLLNTPYQPQIFDILQQYEDNLFIQIEGLTTGNINAISALMGTLLASGHCMTIAGSSQPASQGEHMIAHCMEMLFTDSLPETYHGEQIGVTSLACAEIQQNILQTNSLNWQIADFPTNRFPEGLNNEFQNEYNQKTAQYGKFIRNKLRLEWENIRTKIQPHFKSPASLKEVLERANAPTNNQQIGWDSSKYKTAIELAAFTRNRFTFLDLWCGL